MSDVAAVIERVVATVTAVSPRGTATAVVRETVAAVTAVARQGIAGPPGRDGGGAIQVPAGAALSGHRVVRAGSDGRAVYASCLVSADAVVVLGITNGAADIDTLATVIASGEVDEPSWAWLPGRPIWLGPDGFLVQPQPAVGDLRQIAVALTPTRIAMAFGPTIIRTA